MLNLISIPSETADRDTFLEICMADACRKKNYKQRRTELFLPQAVVPQHNKISSFRVQTHCDCDTSPICRLCLLCRRCPPAIPRCRHFQPFPTSSDNLRLGIRLGLGSGSVVWWLWQYQELFPATTMNDGFQNGGPEPRRQTPAFYRRTSKSQTVYLHAVTLHFTVSSV